MNSKNLLRKKMIKIRRDIIDKNKKSTIIVDKIKRLDIYKESKVVALYNSLPSEVDTKGLFNNKIILLPRIIDNEILFLIIDQDTSYKVSEFGVNEPEINNNIYTGKIDLIIVPGVAFDNNLNRLGFGKGYYDKYLKDRNIYKIGICFDEQVVRSLPVNDLDIKMDMVITDKRIIRKKV